MILGAEVFLEAFWSLSTDRPSAFNGVRMIPFSAIDRYASRYLFDDEFEVFERLIRSMDNVYLEDRKRKTPKNG